ncbi:MAG: alpha/beta fold hydrolase [Planctomycetota bacterium]
MSRRARRLPSLILLALAAAPIGCATDEKWIERRPPADSVAHRLAGLSSKSPPISAVTMAVASPRGFDPTDDDQRSRLLVLLKQETTTQRSAQLEYALSELAAYEADRIGEEDPDAAITFYAESLLHGYRALEADPHNRVRGATARYNRSLESLLRALRKRDQVKPDTVVPLPLAKCGCSLAIEFHSDRWTVADFHEFEFASDFQVLGLRNHYHTSGVGVPLIGVRRHLDRLHPEDKHYPSRLCYPLTAVFRAETLAGDGADGHGVTPVAHASPVNPLFPAPPASAPAPTPGDGRQPVRLVLELHDPMDHAALRLAGREAPLETDLTTPLAYFLDRPVEGARSKAIGGVSTLGLFMPDEAKELEGLYLLEPYDPKRIPVVMVHGLWSSPATWMEMFNDLRSDPTIRSRYQFWFYLYPTGNPFWSSASELRKAITACRATFDPYSAAPAMDQMVLVGHSMGGLLSRLQSVDSGEDFWQIVSERPLSELSAEPEVRRHVEELFYFRPNPSVQRVVTIGTPHRGSRYANGFTQWLGAKLIAFPMQTMAKQQQLFRRNPGFFRPGVATRVMTSIDSLSPDSPVLPTLLAARPGPWVRYHNVVGDVPRNGFTQLFTTRGDGVVSYDSARLDDLPQLASQIVVPEDHVAVHRHPQTIAEVRRVLTEHLVELRAIAPPQPMRSLTPRLKSVARPASIGPKRDTRVELATAIAP